MLFYCVVLLMMHQIECRGPHHPRGATVAKHHVHYRPTRNDNNQQKLTQDEQLLHDREHIQEHLEEEIGEPDLSNLSDEELEFYYFQFHDADHNSKLDGLEILQAIYHTVHHAHKEEDNNDTPEDGVDDDFDYYIELIDKVLEEDDKNNDGYLSYSEYVEGRKRNQLEGTKEPIVQMIT